MGEYTLEKYLSQDTGSAEVQCAIGRCYAKGDGCLADYTAAVQWFEKAALQGDSRAGFYLGQCYFFGAGVQQDYDQAHQWFQVASKDWFMANRYLRQHYLNGNISLKPDFSNFQGLPEAAQRGSASAYTAMGNCFFLGKVGYRDFRTAVQWYQKAALQDDPEAQFCLGYAYVTGAGVTQNREQAFAWFEKSGRQGFMPAIHNLAVCCKHGCGTNYDPQQAKQYLDQLQGIGTCSATTTRLYAPEGLWRDRYMDSLTTILREEKGSD